MPTSVDIKNLKINKLTACGIYVTQNLDPSNDIYIFHTSNGQSLFLTRKK